MSSPSDVKVSVYQMLECPVCFEQMESPIEMCQNGHNFCSKCKNQLSECPMCKAPFTNVRNRALEDVAENMLRPCNNHKFGCQESFMKAALSQHVKVCSYKPLECLPFKKNGCKWAGKVSELYAHMKTHKDCLVYDDLPMKLHFYPTVAMNVVRLAKVENDLFWIYIRQDPQKSKYFRAVQYLGDPKDSSQYRYTFEIEVGDELKTVIGFKKNVYSLKDDIEHLYETNEQLSNLITFIRQCGCESKNIVYMFNILKIKCV